MLNPAPTGYHRDILDQPHALRATLAGLSASPELLAAAAQARAGRFRQIILTGMGSSLHAFYPLYYRLVEHGLSPVMIETSELIHYARAALRPDTLLVACSQSGRSAEIVRLLEIKPPSTPLIGVTNTPASPLAGQSTALVLTHAGSETTVSCKTYTTALAALDWLGDLLTLGEVEPGQPARDALPEQFAAYLDGWREHIAWFQNALRGLRNLFLVGRGPSLAAAETGGLTTKESTHFHAEGMSSAAFRHGPLEMAGPGTTVILFAGLPPTRQLHHRLRDDITQAGGQVCWVGEDSPFPALRLPPAPPRALPLLEILPVQMMTLALAALQGRVAGEFDRATKITAVE